MELAASKIFGDVASYYPGVRAKVPLTYQQFILEQLRAACSPTSSGSPASAAFHGLPFLAGHDAAGTTRRTCSAFRTSIRVHGTELAFIHYLFKADLGGTAFYRHRKTGFEYRRPGTREADYLRTGRSSRTIGPDSPPAEYINGDTPLYEQMGREEGVFNRMLVYRRNSLHSASIGTGFVPDPNPAHRPAVHKRLPGLSRPL